MAKAEDKDNPGYYGIIPAEIRYDVDICPNAKLLYSELTALCNNTGFCWSQNKYFADLYKVSTVTVSRWISQLRYAGYIVVHNHACSEEKKGGNPVIKRLIALNKIVKTPLTKKARPLNNNVKHNNTDNTTENKEDEKPVDEVLSDDEKQRNKDRFDAFNYLRKYGGLSLPAARRIIYVELTPPESIFHVIKNGLAKERQSLKAGYRWILKAGYIVTALKQAKIEGKAIGATKASRELKLEIESMKVERRK